jgi:hypothetical protein
MPPGFRLVVGREGALFVVVGRPEITFNDRQSIDKRRFSEYL